MFDNFPDILCLFAPIYRNRRELQQAKEQRNSRFSDTQRLQQLHLQQRQQRITEQQQERRAREEERLAAIQQRRQAEAEAKEERRLRIWREREERRQRAAQLQEERERARALAVQRNEWAAVPEDDAGTENSSRAPSRQRSRAPSVAMHALVERINEAHRRSVWTRRSARGLGRADADADAECDDHGHGDHDYKEDEDGDDWAADDRDKHDDSIDNQDERKDDANDPPQMDPTAPMTEARASDSTDANPPHSQDKDTSAPASPLAPISPSAEARPASSNRTASGALSRQQHSRTGDRSSSAGQRDSGDGNGSADGAANIPRAHTRSRWDALYVERMQRAFSIQAEPEDDASLSRPVSRRASSHSRTRADTEKLVAALLPEPGPALDVSTLARKSQQQQRSILLNAQMTVYALKKLSEKEKQAEERRRQREEETRQTLRSREMAQRDREESVKEKRAQLDAEMRKKTLMTFEERERRAAERRERQRQEKERKMQAARETANSRHSQAAKLAYDTQHAKEKRVLTRHKLEDETLRVQKDVSDLEIQFLNVLKQQEEEKKRELLTRQVAMRDAERERALCREMERKLAWLEQTVHSLRAMGLDLEKMNYPIPESPQEAM